MQQQPGQVAALHLGNRRLGQWGLPRGRGSSEQAPRLRRPPMRPEAAQRQQQQTALDWRSYRAKLVAMEQAGLLEPGISSPVPFAFSGTSWAHELPAPEPGCLLVARHGAGMQEADFFARTVVCLVAHDTMHGSVGFALNKPSPLRAQEVQLGGTSKGILDAFGTQRLQLGGPVHMDTLTVLHAYAGLSGARQVSEGVSYGGLPAAAELVRCGLARPEEFRLLLGMSGWAPGQLEAEVAAGAWWVVAAGRGLVLPPAEQLVARPPEFLWRRTLELLGR